MEASIQDMVARKRVPSLDALARIVAANKKEGLVTVFTNGCFDLLHAGHVRCLFDARSRGDRLAVAINSDRSIRTMKGPPLPIYPEEDRVQLICALACVDYVYVFEEQTVDHILATAKPDIHAKGSDYTEETVPERKTVLAYGGRIAIVGGAKTHSTRDTVKTIQTLRENQRV
jgi:D-glycero-beta-D-manno-heptose 1-phosphate adenylyltransferase